MHQLVRLIEQGTGFRLGNQLGFEPCDLNLAMQVPKLFQISIPRDTRRSRGDHSAHVNRVMSVPGEGEVQRLPLVAKRVPQMR